MNFAKILKMERIKHAYTQADMAKIMQVSQVSISNWERGAKEPSFETLIKLANLFGKTTDYMLGLK